MKANHVVRDHRLLQALHHLRQEKQTRNSQLSSPCPKHAVHAPSILTRMKEHGNLIIWCYSGRRCEEKNPATVYSIYVRAKKNQLRRLSRAIPFLGFRDQWIVI